MLQYCDKPIVMPSPQRGPIVMPSPQRGPIVMPSPQRGRMASFGFHFAIALLIYPTRAFTSESPSVIIDKIEINPSSNISASDLEMLIEIPTETELTTLEVGTKLQEAKQHLDASGKYGDVDFRLKKSTVPQHFILDSNVQPISNNYSGVSGEISFSRHYDGWYCSCGDDENTKYWKYRAEAYTGTRNWQNTGWAFDLDAAATAGSFKTTDDVNGDASTFYFNQTSSEYDGKLNLSAIRSDFFTGHAYVGGVLLTDFGRHREQFETGYSSWSDSNQRRHGHAEGSFAMDTSNLSAGLLSGLKWANFSLGARALRSRNHFLNLNQNLNSESYINDKKDENGDPIITFFTGTKPQYRSSAFLTLAYSQKPKINLVEEGLDSSLTWHRTYRTEYTDYPEVLAHLEYTIRTYGRYAWTPMFDEIWRYQDVEYNKSSVLRMFQAGTRIDYISDAGLVWYGQFVRAFASHNELESQYEQATRSNFMTRNRADIGVQYASPEFLYSFSFIYGQTIAELVDLNHKQFERLGVH